MWRSLLQEFRADHVIQLKSERLDFHELVSAQSELLIVLDFLESTGGLWLDGGGFQIGHITSPS